MKTKIYNVVPQTANTFVSNYFDLKTAKAKAKEWALFAHIDTAVYENESEAEDKFICMFTPEGKEVTTI